MTSRAGRRPKERGAAAGVRGWVVKPFHNDAGLKMVCKLAN